MTSEVQISRMALSLIGAKSQVLSLDPPDGTVEAGLCADFLPLARRLAIENGTFSFSYKRATLAQLSVNLSDVWQYACAIPEDCLFAMRIVRNSIPSKAALFMSPDTIAGGALMNESEGANFYQEDGTIYTNESPAVLLYKRDVIDPRFYTPGFEASVAMALASLIAGPLIGGADGIRIGEAWRERASAQAKIASANSANASKVDALHTPGWMSMRG